MANLSNNGMVSSLETKHGESQEEQPSSFKYKCMKQYMCEKVENDSNKVVCLTVHRFFRKIRGHLEEVRSLNG
ncbi:hypothetical protein SPOG_03202 [Schizosaccharomyces cryophilus OY26]|uniref:Uncharacterized protein n=1 Tax=Schizosaccharomyces cryophilus (strain OY26 / ATCC MYA-4695 / CBS 11777 / NBRC 106824 / NRRL Y48691) TaxID=653667 RepID=S9VUD9_SCHCR|nr:uncharacterized protein SPOG_03202 [Schizosaccharomyces cryophilus OY26]EPY49725.1 hypothetical protein SPOG_03202 [Schizosaccharomyces cryophilus OY26]